MKPSARAYTPLASPTHAGSDASTPPPQHHKQQLHHRLYHHARLAGLFAAITGCFLVYSLIQERLMTLGFGPQKERFSHSVFIILVNRLLACAVAAAALGLAGESVQPAAPLALFAVPSIANVLGSASQYEALKYVSFPLQALAKCAKTVPVMAWGLLLGGRRYDAIDYICAGTVTLGCALFVLTGSIAAPQQLHAAAAAATAAFRQQAAGQDAGPWAAAAHAAKGEANSSWMLYGLLLLGAFLLFDGLTSTTQDRLFAQHEMHSCNQLLWVSAWSAAVSLSLLAASGQLMPSLAFVGRHPAALSYILLLSLVSTAVQLFIFYTIQQYGALHFALIMTLRQFLSIILSCAVFRHSLTASQWCGTLLVIGGLAARGMHRGGLTRSLPSKALGATPSLSFRKAGSLAPAASLLLPLTMMVPVIEQAGAAAAVASGNGTAFGSTDEVLAALKKLRGGIPLEVQAGALASGGGGDAAARKLKRGSPLAAGGGASLAGAASLTSAASLGTRRKPVEPTC